jgi:hypothetical protein
MGAMGVKFKLLIPADVILGYQVDGDRVLVSLLLCAETGNILSCICSFGYQAACSKVRLTATAFNGVTADNWALSPRCLFSPCNVVPRGANNGPLRFHDHFYINFSEKSIRRSTGQIFKSRSDEMLLYFLYDRPLDSYLFDCETNKLSAQLFRRVLLSALSKYSNWIRNRGMK